MLTPLHYSEHSPNNDTTDGADYPVVVLLHGLFGSNDNLSVIRRHLEAEYRVINIDLPDHGRSPRSNTFSFEVYARQVLLTLKQLKINKASIVGHSLGGKIAMWIAYLKPQLIDKLIILDIAPTSYEPRHQSVLDGLNSVPLDKIQSRKDAIEHMGLLIKDASTQSFLLKSLYEENGNWKWRFNLALLTRDYAKLSDWTLSDKTVYKNKMLFIKGEHSDYITLQHQATIKAQFPEAIAKIVSAGHWLHAEKPQVVNGLITKYLHGE